MVSDNRFSFLRGFSSSEHHPVVSLYLDVDGARFPTKADYETKLSSLVREARKSAAGDLSLTRDEENRLDSEFQAINEYVSLQFRRNGARTLAIFSCRPEGLWEVMPLGITVESRIFVNWEPHLAPLLEAVTSHADMCILVTNKETARIFTVRSGVLEEHPEIMDSVLKRHEQGGWEQTKFQRRHEQQVRNHLKRAADAAMDFFKQDRFDRIAFGIADELWPELEKVIHPWLKERMVLRFPVDINASTDEILSKVDEAEERRQRKEQETLLKSLGPELDAGKTYVGGLDDVLAMLNQRRVDLLLVEEGYRQAGRYCPACNTLESGEESCPACGQPVRQIADVVEEARELAVRQDAIVRSIPIGHPAIAQAEHIAARLRY